MLGIGAFPYYDELDADLITTRASNDQLAASSSFFSSADSFANDPRRAYRT